MTDEIGCLKDTQTPLWLTLWSEYWIYFLFSQECEAGEVYLLMKEEYRISRNIRASWFFGNLNKEIKVKASEDLVSRPMIGLEWNWLKDLVQQHHRLLACVQHGHFGEHLESAPLECLSLLFNQFTSGILFVFSVPRTGLFSVKNQKKFLAIKFLLSMKQSPDTQTN